MNDEPPLITGSDDKLWIVLSHLSIFLGVGIVLPLIVYLVKKNESEAITYHAKEALNFHISVLIYSIACFLLTFIVIGILGFIVLALACLVLPIIAAIKGADGEAYRYPFTIRLVN